MIEALALEWEQAFREREEWRIPLTRAQLEKRAVQARKSRKRAQKRRKAVKRTFRQVMQEKGVADGPSTAIDQARELYAEDEEYAHPGEWASDVEWEDYDVHAIFQEFFYPAQGSATF